MARKARTLTRPYSAYWKLRAKENALLTHVGPGTPCGEYLRRFWQPIELASAVADRPIALRILGEDLVLFRDRSGRLGLLEQRCSHRGASLEFGRITEQGIQCCYHGWHYAVDGRVIETPVEPPDFRPKLYHGAYPVREAAGLIFAYMGPPEEAPDFPAFDFFDEPVRARIHYKRHSPCNWLQIRDNEVDNSHGAFLHTVMAGVQLSTAYHELPLMDWRESPLGILATQIRRIKDKVFVRVNELIIPNLVRIAGIEDGEGVTMCDRRGPIINWCVPIDDTNSWVIGWNVIEPNLPDPRRDAYMDREVRAGHDPFAHPQLNFQLGQDGDRPLEERRSVPGDWDAWVSQGPITIHAQEHLGPNDYGVVLYRKLVRDGINAVAAGHEPKGLVRRANGPIETYANNTVMPVPKRPSAEDDTRACLEFGRGVIVRTLSGELRRESASAQP